ncbi:MAG TPA: universal stress protein [Clostridia bacterium]|jgi:nucleotide-binding universal stress UspA family protein|nr:universal stress protein [Clostridia bacterium]
MKILVAIDGSENSLRAARYAAKTAAHFPGSKVSLVYVDTMSVQVKVKGGGIPPNYEELVNEGRKASLEGAEKIFFESQVPYNVKVLEGYDIAETICDFAREYNYDQIIMGTRGLGNLKGIVLGSVSHKVISIAPCPVTFVK